MRFEGCAPILTVRDLAASLDYYVNILGFKIDWEDKPLFASVSRDRCCIFLCEGGQGNPGTWVWIGVEDAGALFEELQAKGARIRHPPANYWWAYEMQVTDLDGNVLRCGSEPKEGEPPGEWLDMHGHRWQKLAEGGWRKVEE